MIISASRRTDIPSFYAEWFFHRLREGYVYVRNPMNPRRISEVSLSPAVVDGIVFWTKNPAPMLSRLDALRDYPYYFQFTLNPYGTDIERNVPSKNEVVIPTFQRVSSLLGKERVVWRYDPILLNEKYTLPYHIACFRLLCDKLSDYTEKCTISFIDLYQSIKARVAPLGITALSPGQMEELMGRFSETAKEHGIAIDTCAEEAELSRFGIQHARCIDSERLARIGGFPLLVEKDKHQRPACGCAASVDIGAYNTCGNGCVYCYANYRPALIDSCRSEHKLTRPLLVGEVGPNDLVTPRAMSSCRDGQTRLALDDPAPR